jgi:hypothetical protein
MFSKPSLNDIPAPAVDERAIITPTKRRMTTEAMTIR